LLVSLRDIAEDSRDITRHKAAFLYIFPAISEIRFSGAMGPRAHDAGETARRASAFRLTVADRASFTAFLAFAPSRRRVISRIPDDRVRCRGQSAITSRMSSLGFLHCLAQSGLIVSYISLRCEYAAMGHFTR